jgi:hypothetical protein
MLAQDEACYEDRRTQDGKFHPSSGLRCLS